MAHRRLKRESVCLQLLKSNLSCFIDDISKVERSLEKYMEDIERMGESRKAVPERTNTEKEIENTGYIIFLWHPFSKSHMLLQCALSMVSTYGDGIARSIIQVADAVRCFLSLHEL